MRQNGGPAFPRPASVDPSSGTLQDGDCVVDAHDGMSLRDWFAGQVISALLAGDTNIIPYGCEGKSSKEYTQGDFTRHFANLSYDYADAMLKARNQ